MFKVELPSGRIVEFANHARASKWFHARDFYHQNKLNENFSCFADGGNGFYYPVFREPTDDPWGRSPYVLQAFQNWKENYYQLKYGE